MRSFALSPILIILLSTPLFGQWEIINEGPGYGYIRCSDQINHTAWVAGTKGIFKFTDKDEKWTLLNDEFDFSDIDFIDAMRGWAVVDINYGPILKTEDGGASWSNLKHEGIGEISELQVINDSTIFIFGDRVLKTKNGGSEWEEITPPTGHHFNSLHFINPDTGFVVPDWWTSEGFYITYDGGITWEDKRIPEFEYISGIMLSGDSSMYFISKDSLEQYSLCTTKDVQQLEEALSNK